MYILRRRNKKKKRKPHLKKPPRADTIDRRQKADGTKASVKKRRKEKQNPEVGACRKDARKKTWAVHRGEEESSLEWGTGLGNKPYDESVLQGDEGGKETIRGSNA